jgi:hypothetical protein
LVTGGGIITTVAGSINGNYGYSGDNGPATSALLNGAAGIAVDSSGNLYIADEGNDCVRKVSPSAVITTIAGNGNQGFSGDGGPGTSAELYFPSGVAVAPDGRVYIADSYNQRVRQVSTNGTITTLAGVSWTGASGGGFSGDGGLSTSARLNVPSGVAVDSFGSVYIADMLNNRVRRILPSGIITTVAGSGSIGYGTGGYAGDGGAATSALLNSPLDVAVNAAGGVYVADSGNYVVRLLQPTGQVIPPSSAQPTIGIIQPSTAPAGSAPLSVTITGTNFLSTSAATFNAVSHPVAFVSPTQLVIALSASDLAAPGTYPIIVTNPGSAASNAMNFTVVSGGLSLEGKSFTINGTITLSGQQLAFEIQTLATSDSAYFVELDNDISAASGIQFEEEFNSGLSVSGNTGVYSGSSAAGFYSNLNTNYGIPITITSATLTITFTSSAPGSAVSGNVTFSISSGTIQGTFTGTLASPGLS